MSTKPPKTDEVEEIGKPHPTSDRAGERARDEQREEGGPRYGGEAWEVADKRGDKRFGEARNDDADPSELRPGEGAEDDDEWPGHDASPQSDKGESEEVATETAAASDTVTESGGQHAGFGRGEKPQKPKARTKKNPQSSGKRER